VKLVVTTLPTTTVPGDLLGTVSLDGAKPLEFACWIRPLVVLDDDLRPTDPIAGVDYLLALTRLLGRCSYVESTPPTPAQST
jgi:hypothetical protein